MAAAWIEKKEGWLGRYKRETPPQGKYKKKETKKQEIENDYIVIYKPIICPRCKSKKQKCYKTDLPVRYHKCGTCGHNFKSVEYI